MKTSKEAEVRHGTGRRCDDEEMKNDAASKEWPVIGMLGGIKMQSSSACWL